jgi:hypothetical protein
LHTSVIERSIQPPKLGNSPVNHFSNLRLIRYVAANGNRLVSFLREFLYSLSHQSFIAIGKRNCRTLLCEGTSRGETHSLSGSSDQRNLVLEP